MSKRTKRTTYRQPDDARRPGSPASPRPTGNPGSPALAPTPTPAAAQSREPTHQAPDRTSQHRSLADWWPLAAAAMGTALLVLIVVLANLDSPPNPALP